MSNIALVNDNIVFEENNLEEIIECADSNAKCLVKCIIGKCTIKWNINKNMDIELCIHIINYFFTTDIKIRFGLHNQVLLNISTKHETRYIQPYEFGVYDETMHENSLILKIFDYNIKIDLSLYGIEYNYDYDNNNV